MLSLPPPLFRPHSCPPQRCPPIATETSPGEDSSLGGPHLPSHSYSQFRRQSRGFSTCSTAPLANSSSPRTSTFGTRSSRLPRASPPSGVARSLGCRRHAQAVWAQRWHSHLSPYPLADSPRDRSVQMYCGHRPPGHEPLDSMRFRSMVTTDPVRIFKQVTPGS